MAELLLVNPHHKRKARKSRRRKTNPMPPALARWHAMHPHGRRRRRKNNPARHHARRRTHHVGHRRRKTNPSFRGLGGGLTSRLMGSLKQGLVGAVGGLGNDLVMGQVLPRLPAMLGSGFGAVAVKAAGAVLVATLGGMLWKGRGRDLGDGAMTVVLHDFLKAELQPMLPSFLPMGEYLTFAPTVGYSGMGEYLTGNGSNMMGEYIAADIGNPDYYGAQPPGMLN